MQIDSIARIDNTNDSIINPISYPDLGKNGLVVNVASTELFDFQNEDYVKKIVQEYFDKKGIVDNETQTKRFAIIKKREEFILNEFQTETRYYYDEGCEIVKKIAIVSENVVSENIFCIFQESPILTHRRFNYQTIEDCQNRYIEPRKAITYSDNLDSLKLIYEGTSCYESFEYGGLGTIMPLFINVSLRILDLKNKQDEKIIQIPYNYSFNIKNIKLADINSDMHNDIIIETEDELCTYRMVYLTNIKNGITKYDYIGKMEVYCDCP